MSNERGLTDVDIASSLSQVAETTTTAELVRRTGQTKQVKVLSQRKLMEWIQTLLQQQMAGREDAFSDQEKEELLRKTQEELAARIEREREAEKARQKAQAELDALMNQMQSRMTEGQHDHTALEQLKVRLGQAEEERGNLQQDVYELEDQLKEKLALLSATIAEKDKLRDSMRTQMRRSTGLVEGVLGLDDHYYGGSHAINNPASDDLDEQGLFYHDYDVGAKVIETLSKDLRRLRAITDDKRKAAVMTSGEQRLLAQDIELLSKLKEGSLNAIDVAAPVSGLIEALEGARLEHLGLQAAIAAASGMTSKEQPLSEVPDAEGDPAQVIAGATRVVREIAAEAARQKARVQALKRIADEADDARNQAEDELEAVRKSGQGADPSQAAAAAQLTKVKRELEEAQALMRVAQADADKARAEATAAKSRTSDSEGTNLAVQMLQKRMTHALGAIRQLASTLSVASAGTPNLEDARVDLELGISQLATARSATMVPTEALDGIATTAKQIADQLGKGAGNAKKKPSVDELELE